MRTTLVPYLWRRFLRIYPAFLVSLLVVAAVFAPLAAALEGTSLDVASAVQLRAEQRRPANLAVGHRRDPGPGPGPGLLERLALDAVPRGPRLPADRARPQPRRRGADAARWVLPGLFLVVLVLRPLVEGPLEVTSHLELNGARLVGYFLSGAAVWAWAGTWRPTWVHVAGAGVVYAVLRTRAGRTCTGSCRSPCCSSASAPPVPELDHPHRPLLRRLHLRVPGAAAPRAARHGVVGRRRQLPARRPADAAPGAAVVDARRARPAGQGVARPPRPARPAGPSAGAQNPSPAAVEGTPSGVTAPAPAPAARPARPGPPGRLVRHRGGAYREQAGATPPAPTRQEHPWTPR